MTIHHLVIAGGGQTLLQALGAIQHLEKKNFIQKENITSIYGTSAGGIVAVLYAFHFDWETLNDFIIKRPWNDVFPINVQNILDAYTNKGIFNEDVFKKFIKPLLDAKDLSLEITLKEFYEYSKIEIHFFTFEINNFIIEDISYLSHPEQRLIQVLQMTCGIPVLISPVCIENKCYIDCGMASNYPLNFCLNKFTNVDEILGIRYNYGSNSDNISYNQINSQSSLLDFIMNFLFKILDNLNSTNNQSKIPNEIVCKASIMSISVLKSAIYSSEIRKDLIDCGMESAKEFIENLTKS